MSRFLFSSTNARHAIIIQRFYLSTNKDFGLKNHFYYRESPLMNKIDKKQIPLVLVLGWAGAIDKHVLKYSQMYENMGCHTIRLSPTVGLSVFKPELHKVYAIKLLDLIKAKPELNNSPIVVHTFSNAGTFIYRHVSDILHDVENQYSYLKPNIKTMIYDSGPGSNDDLNRLKKAVLELVQTSVKYKILSYPIAYTGFFYWDFKYLKRRPNFLDKNIEALKRDKFEIPILSIFSKADDLIDYKQILNFISERKKNAPNVKIETVLFEDSPHCTHYLVHTDVYVEKLRKHLIESNIPLHNQIKSN